MLSNKIRKKLTVSSAGIFFWSIFQFKVAYFLTNVSHPASKKFFFLLQQNEHMPLGAYFWDLSYMSARDFLDREDFYLPIFFPSGELASELNLESRWGPNKAEHMWKITS